MCHNGYRLAILHIEHNLYSEDALTGFLRRILTNLPWVCLRMLSVDSINNEQDELIESINDHRKRILRLPWPNAKLVVPQVGSQMLRLRNEYINAYIAFESLNCSELAYRRPHH